LSSWAGFILFEGTTLGIEEILFGGPFILFSKYFNSQLDFTPKKIAINSNSPNTIHKGLVIIWHWGRSACVLVFLSQKRFQYHPADHHKDEEEQEKYL
jgi:hypothetical protein